MQTQFAVEVVVEGALGTLLLGASSLPTKKLAAVLNDYGARGWQVAFMVVESRRMFLLWRREAVVVTFSRPAPSPVATARPPRRS